MTTYAAVNMRNMPKDKFDDIKKKAQTAGAKSAMVTTSFATILKSMDGSIGILEWASDVDIVAAGDVLFKGTAEEIAIYLEKNKAMFTTLPLKGGPPTKQQVVRSVVSMSSETRPSLETPTPTRIWRWVAAVAVAGAAYAAYHYYLV